MDFQIHLSTGSQSDPVESIPLPGHSNQPREEHMRAVNAFKFRIVGIALRAADAHKRRAGRQYPRRRASNGERVGAPRPNRVSAAPGRALTRRRTTPAIARVTVRACALSGFVGTRFVNPRVPGMGLSRATEQRRHPSSQTGLAGSVMRSGFRLFVRKQKHLVEHDDVRCAGQRATSDSEELGLHYRQERTSTLEVNVSALGQKRKARYVIIR